MAHLQLWYGSLTITRTGWMALGLFMMPQLSPCGFLSRKRKDSAGGFDFTTGIPRNEQQKWWRISGKHKQHELDYISDCKQKLRISLKVETTHDPPHEANASRSPHNAAQHHLTTSFQVIIPHVRVWATDPARTKLNRLKRPLIQVQGRRIWEESWDLTSQAFSIKHV